MTTAPNSSYTKWIALLGATALVTLLFLEMIRPFLVALILAAITASMASPLQARMMIVTRKRRGLAAALTLLILCLGLVAPLLGVMWAAATQADAISAGAKALAAEIQNISADDELPEWLPFRDQIGPLSGTLTAKLGELAGAAGEWVAGSLGKLASGAAQFFLEVFVYLYAVFLFLQMDRSVISLVLSYSGLPAETQTELAQRMVSISRATLKGTVLIGAAQGALGAIGFWAAGIEGPAFWGVTMMVLSIIPGLGPLLIVFFGVVWLFAQGEVTAAIGLAAWGVLVVGTIDNILRPILVGRDAALHDVWILVSTLGGLAMLGASGLVLGPVLAGLFVTLWETVSEQTGDGPKREASAGANSDDGLLDEELSKELEDLRRKHREREARQSNPDSGNN